MLRLPRVYALLTTYTTTGWVRDERKGYGGDAQLAAEEAIFNFDMTATFLKFLR